MKSAGLAIIERWPKTDRDTGLQPYHKDSLSQAHPIQFGGGAILRANPRAIDINFSPIERPSDRATATSASSSSAATKLVHHLSLAFRPRSS